MTIADVLLQDFDVEMASTRRILERIPEEHHDFKPHEKSFSLGKLAMHVATLPQFGRIILTTPGMNMKDPKQSFPDTTYRTRDILLETFASAAAACRSALSARSDAEMLELWHFSFGDHVISNAPRVASYRLMFFNHFLHHRGQLAVYLRLKDIPVPGLYGPSADEPFTPQG